MTSNRSRRDAIAILASAALLPNVVRSATANRPKVFLRSSWQTVNIGDIAHTPGVLALLEKFIPEADVWLWPSNVGNGVDSLLRRRFSNLEIIQGPERIARAFRECDFLMHGSGPSLVAESSVAQWVNETSKPYGVYGVTLSNISDATLRLLDRAQFVFCRDSVSLAHLRDRGCKAKRTDFAPDGAFAVDVRNDQAAETFLKQNGLEPGKFLCCIGRLRKTPYWKIRSKPMTEADKVSHERNEAMKEHDHAPLRQAIVEVVRNSELKILLVPEDESQMSVAKEMLYDPLPDDVKRNVVWRRDFWLTDEALSTYVRSAGLFGNEMHSPIMCIGNGVPAVVCRWAEQTSKGYMWKDIGLGEWLFDFDDDSNLAKVAPVVMSIAKDPSAARERVAAARKVVQEKQQFTMAIVKEELLAAASK